MNHYPHDHHQNDENERQLFPYFLNTLFPGGGQPGFPGSGPFPGGGPGGQPGFPPPPPPPFPGGGGGGGGQSGAPTSPPPSFTPQLQAQVYAVDPGAIRGCLYRYTYVWLRRRSFWFYPTYVGRTSVAGYRWNGRRWSYYGTDLDNIQSFQCF